jgi:hypothetical protein
MPARGLIGNYTRKHAAELGSTDEQVPDNVQRFSLTGAAPDFGAFALRLVRRAAKRKTLYVQAKNAVRYQ